MSQSTSPFLTQEPKSAATTVNPINNGFPTMEPIHTNGFGIKSKFSIKAGEEVRVQLARMGALRIFAHGFNGNGKYLTEVCQKSVKGEIIQTNCIICNAGIRQTEYYVIEVFVFRGEYDKTTKTHLAYTGVPDHQYLILNRTAYSRFIDFVNKLKVPADKVVIEVKGSAPTMGKGIDLSFSMALDEQAGGLYAPAKILDTNTTKRRLPDNIEDSFIPPSDAELARYTITPYAS